MLETSADIDFYVIMKSYFSDGAGIGAISSGGRAIIGAEEKLFDTRNDSLDKPQRASSKRLDR